MIRARPASGDCKLNIVSVCIHLKFVMLFLVRCGASLCWLRNLLCFSRMAVYAVSVCKLRLTVMSCTDTVVVLRLHQARTCLVLAFFTSFLRRGRHRGSLSNRASNSGRRWTAQYNAMHASENVARAGGAEEHVPHGRKRVAFGDPKRYLLH